MLSMILQPSKFQHLKSLGPEVKSWETTNTILINNNLNILWKQSTAKAFFIVNTAIESSVVTKTGS